MCNDGARRLGQRSVEVEEDHIHFAVDGRQISPIRLGRHCLGAPTEHGLAAPTVGA